MLLVRKKNIKMQKQKSVNIIYSEAIFSSALVQNCTLSIPKWF